jgi:hypothetical protein
MKNLVVSALSLFLGFVAMGNGAVDAHRPNFIFLLGE